MAKRETSYEMWLKEEGIPVIDGYGVEDVTVLPRKPWQRTGGSGAYIDLKGMEGFTGMFVTSAWNARARRPVARSIRKAISMKN